VGVVAESSFSGSGAAVICSGPRGVLLTDDGWLATKATAGFESLKVFRLIEISSIKNIELVPSYYGKKSHLLLRVSLIMAIMTFAWLLLRDGAVLWNGCVDAVDGIIFSGCEGDHSTLESVALAISTMGIPLGVLITIWRFELWPISISIEQENGAKSEIREDFEWFWVYSYAGAFIFWWFASPIGTAGLQSRLESPVNLIVLVFMVGAFLVIKEISNMDDNKSRRLGVGDFFEKIVEERTERKKLERGFRSEYKRLGKHRHELSKIFSDYETIFKPGSTRQAVLTISTCLETLFKERLRAFGGDRKTWVDQPKKWKNTYSTLYDKLMKEDKEGIGKEKRKASYIGDLRNNSAHKQAEPDLGETKVALGYFVDLVKVHFEQPIVGESSD